MDSGYSYHLPLTTFQELINTYNSQEERPNIKTETLQNIKAIIHDFLEKTSSQEDIRKVRSLLGQVKVQFEDKDLWNQIMGEIEDKNVLNQIMREAEKAPSTISIRDLELICCSSELPTEVCWLIIQKMRMMDSLIELLNKPSDIPHERRFQLALQCGKDLLRLDLSHFQELNNEKLKLLQKACPNLRLLRLSHTPIEVIDLSILNGFSNLITLDVSGTNITTLDKFPQKLKVLNLRGCNKLKAKEFEKFHSFSQLEKLEISNTEITTLDKLPQSLKELHLGYCYCLKAEEFKNLQSLSKLEKLDVSGTEIATLSKLPQNLKELILYRCNKLKAKEFEKLHSFSRLEKLDLSFTNIETLDKLPINLKDLKLVDCPPTAKEFEKLDSLLKLEKLDLSCTEIATLNKLPKNLKELSLWECKNLATEEIKNLASFANLQLIYLSRRFENEEIISFLKAHNKQLKLYAVKGVYLV